MNQLKKVIFSDKIQTKKAHVSYNTGNTEWYTPSEFTDAARITMGTIDLDPASTAEANKTVQAKKFYTKEIDGLTQKWEGNIWLNPPYAQPLMSQFADAVTNKYVSREIAQAIVLTNNATETKWFQKLLTATSAVCLIKGRIKFVSPEGKTGTPLQGQIILYFGNNPDKFTEQFTKFGQVMWASEKNNLLHILSQKNKSYKPNFKTKQ